MESRLRIRPSPESHDPPKRVVAAWFVLAVNADAPSRFSPYEPASRATATLNGRPGATRRWAQSYDVNELQRSRRRRRWWRDWGAPLLAGVIVGLIAGAVMWGLAATPANDRPEVLRTMAGLVGGASAGGRAAR